MPPCADAFCAGVVAAVGAKVSRFKVGDKVHTDQGLTNIHSIVVKREVQTVHNLQVQDSHTFYVMDDGEKRYLVHNTGGGGGSSK